MELSVLDSTYRRSKLIENWNSLVWTERHSKNGDFQLVTTNISETLNLLPLGDDDAPPTLVAVEDSETPMIVETHKIERTDGGLDQLVTTGRTFETVLDRRITVNLQTTPRHKRLDWKITADTAAIAAYELAERIIVDGEISPLDVIPEIILLNSVSDTGTTKDFVIEPKDLYTAMVEILALGSYGIRSELAPAYDKIAVVIYKGEDKREDVVFSVELDQLDKPTYLLSKAGYKNVMLSTGQSGWEFATLAGAEPSGLLRRVGYQDLSSTVTIDADAPELAPLLVNKGKVALADLLPIALFAGGVTDSISEGYGTRYSLGDIVTLQGEFDLSQVARIAEFVRTEDSTGYKVYPTFEAVIE